LKKVIFRIIFVCVIISLVIFIRLFILKKNEVEKLNFNVDKYKIELEKTIDQNKLDKDLNLKILLKEKKCEYTETYEFIDYYENDSLFSNSGTFNIILEKFQSKTGPKIEMLNDKQFSKDFVKGKNYEITYVRTIDYSHGFVNDYYKITKIVPTDKIGLGQVQELCVFD